MKGFKLAGLLLAVSVIFGFYTGFLHARITGSSVPTSADQWCVGAASAEVCVDSSGNIVPTTTGTQALGTSSLAFSDLRTGTATHTGAVTMSGTNTLSGATTISGALTTSSASGITNTYGIVTGTVAATATGGAVTVATATTSGVKLILAGVFQTLPTSGYSKGSIAIQLSDNKVYVATNTVTEAGSWQSIGAQ